MVTLVKNQFLMSPKVKLGISKIGSKTSNCSKASRFIAKYLEREDLDLYAR